LTWTELRDASRRRDDGDRSGRRHRAERPHMALGKHNVRARTSPRASPQAWATRWSRR
jgi:hypothetical protein